MFWMILVNIRNIGTFVPGQSETLLTKIFSVKFQIYLKQFWVIWVNLVQAISNFALDQSENMIFWVKNSWLKILG